MKIVDAVKIIPTCENFKKDFTIYALLTVVVTVLSYTSKSDFFKDTTMLLLSSLIIIGCAILTCGYYLVALRNYMLCKPNFLPEWFKKHDIKEITIGALKYMLALFLCIIIVALWNIIGMHLIKTNQFAAPVFISLVIINISFLVAIIVFLPAITIEFCTNLKFRSFFNLQQIVSIIQTAGWHYYKAVGIVLLLNLIITVFYNYTQNILSLNIIFSVFSTYVSLIAAIFYGDVFRKVVEKRKEQESI